MDQPTTNLEGDLPNLLPNPNSQTTAIITGLVILAGSAFLALSFKANLWNKPETATNPTPIQKYTMQNAKIINANSDYLVIKGSVKSEDTKQLEEVVVTLKVDSRTIVKNFVPVTKDGKLVSTQPNILEANLSDLIPDTRIVIIKTLGDIFTSKHVRAIEIDYVTQNIQQSKPSPLPLASPKK